VLLCVELEISNLIHGFVWAMPSRRVSNFPESRRGLGHVSLTIFGSTVGYPSDSLASCSLVFSLVLNSMPGLCNILTAPEYVCSS